MNPNSPIGRRQLLGVSGSVVLLLNACKKDGPSSCTNVAGLSQADIGLRTTLEYVDRSPVAAQTCDVCVQWIPAPSSDACGGCKVMKGPVHPKGHCKVFAPK